jgi:tellurite resistance protein TerC
MTQASQHPDRKDTSMPFQRALLWSLFWVWLSLLTALTIWLLLPNGHEAALAFLAGYIIEKALSVDNLFVFLMLFTYFTVKPSVQRKVLNYGIIGVILMRGIMIFAGIELVNRFEFLMYIFGVIVVYTGFRLSFGKEEDEFSAEKSSIIKWTRKFFTVTNEFHGDKFFIREAGKHIATPLFVVLVVIELTDVLFALDSIPAVFAVTRDPFIVYGSNLLAVFGLRSMYFLLERMHDAFRFVKKGVGVILWFVGAKMILPLFWSEANISVLYSLIIIIGILLISILASLVFREEKK